MKIMWIFRDEPFKQSGDYVERADTVDDLWIEILHFGTVSFVQNLEPRAFFDVGLSAPAGCERKQKNDQP